LTADFRTRPLETVEAHVCKLFDILSAARFDSLLYLSSTRLYGTQSGLAKEDSDFSVNPGNPNDLYNISKLMGEALLNSSDRCVRIARLSNVFGGDINSENFLSDIIKRAVQTGHVKLETSFESEKDYIGVGDAVDLLIKIASGGKQKVYNVASGINTSNHQITDKLADLTRCVIEVATDARVVKFPVVSNELVRSEFGFRPSNLLDEMEKLIVLYQNLDGEC
jgi:nucleoside-diphosphate-sugar epimerase